MSVGVVRTDTHVGWHAHTYALMLRFNVYWHRCMQQPSPPLWWCQIRKPGERGGVLMKEKRRTCERWRWMFFYSHHMQSREMVSASLAGLYSWLISHSKALNTSTWPHASLREPRGSRPCGPDSRPVLSAVICALRCSCLDSSSDVWPPPCEASWLRLNCEGKQMQPLNSPLSGGGGWSGKSLEPLWKSLSCWKKGAVRMCSKH